MSQTPLRLVATSSQTVGPFFHFGLADNATLGCLVRADTPRRAHPAADSSPRRRRRAGAGRAHRALAGRRGRRLRAPPESEGRAHAVRVLRLRAPADRGGRRLRVRDDPTRVRSVMRKVALRRRTSTSASSPVASCGRSTRASTSRAIRISKRMPCSPSFPRTRRATLLAQTGRPWRVGLRPPAAGRRAKPCSSISDRQRDHVITVDRQPGDDRRAGGGLFRPVDPAGDARLRGRARARRGHGRRDSRAARRTRLPPRPEPRHFDAEAIAREARDSGTVSIPLVKALTARVQAADAASARFVHFGATSQDVADSAMVLTLRRAHAILAADHARLDAHAPAAVRSSRADGDARADAAATRAADHVWSQGRGLGRRARARLEASRGRDGRRGRAAVWRRRGHARRARRPRTGRLARRSPANSGSACPTRRGTRTAIGWPRWSPPCGIYTATLGKIARDITLLMQDEVGEAAEPGGGSSTMPHKRNPAACARRARGGDAPARPRRGVPDRHGAGTRTRGRRLARRVADDRRRRAGDRVGARGDGRRSPADCPSIPTGCAPTSSGPTARSSPSAR